MFQATCPIVCISSTIPSWLKIKKKHLTSKASDFSNSQEADLYNVNHITTHKCSYIFSLLKSSNILVILCNFGQRRVCSQGCTDDTYCNNCDTRNNLHMWQQIRVNTRGGVHIYKNQSQMRTQKVVLLDKKNVQGCLLFWREN